MDLMDDYDRKRRATNTFGKGVFTGIIMMVVIMLMIDAGGPTKTDLEREIEAYQLCIKINKCRMDPGDFIDYYDLKYKLLQEED